MTLVPLRAHVLRVLGRYSKLLRQRPVLTKSITAAAVGTAGDGVAQSLELRYRDKSNRGQFDVRRTLVFASFAGLIGAPISHFWYLYLGRKFPGRTVRTISSRVALDQLAMAPLMLPLTLFYLDYGSRRFAHGEKQVSLVKESVQTAYRATLPTLMANWTLWPFAQVVNFIFVPPEFQVLFVNVIGLGWNTYLSLAASAALERQNEIERKEVTRGMRHEF